MDPDPLSAPQYLIPLIAVLLALSAFFSASETAFLSVNTLKIRYLREKKSRTAALVEFLLHRRDTLLTSILIGNNLVNIALTAVITNAAWNIFGSAVVGAVTGMTTLAILIIGEIIPKSTALSRPEFCARLFAVPVTLFVLIFLPFGLIFTAVSGLLRQITGWQHRRHTSNVSEEDIRSLIDAGTEAGTIGDSDSALMHRILRYTDLTVREIMTPRTAITAIPITATANEILRISHESRFSRFPVYNETIDDIAGILYIKDFLFLDPANGTFSIKDCIRSPLYITAGRRIDAVQKILRDENRNMAIVLDEYGGTAGIVTTEDLIEELFGNIHDEHDIRSIPEEEKTGPEASGRQGGIVLAGSTRIDEINDQFNLTLSSDYHETVAGLVMELYGDIPAPGSSVLVDGIRLTVASMQGQRIDSIILCEEERS